MPCTSISDTSPAYHDWNAFWQVVATRLAKAGYTEGSRQQYRYILRSFYRFCQCAPQDVTSLTVRKYLWYLSDRQTSKTWMGMNISVLRTAFDRVWDREVTRRSISSTLIYKDCTPPDVEPSGALSLLHGKTPPTKRPVRQTINIPVCIELCALQLPFMSCLSSLDRRFSNRYSGPVGKPALRETVQAANWPQAMNLSKPRSSLHPIADAPAALAALRALL